MNPLLKTAARHAIPHLHDLTRGRKKKMLKHAGKWAASQVMRKQKASMGSMALKGLGAAAIAIPVGMWIGKKLLEGDAGGEVH